MALDRALQPVAEADEPEAERDQRSRGRVVGADQLGYHLGELAGLIAQQIGSNDAAPATLITLGLGLIGLRDRLERGLRSIEKR